MVFILPFIFGALGLAAGAVAGAFTAHAAGESDRQAANHHRTVANELAEKYAALEKRYYQLADESKSQILNLTRQHALDEVEKDCLRLAVRLQHNLISLMWEIDREPTEVALKKFIEAVEITNTVLCQLNEELIVLPSDYYARNLIAAVQGEKFLNVHFSNNSILSDITDEDLTEEMNLEKNNCSEINQEEIAMKDNHQNMPSQEFQETHNRIHDTGNRLLKYLQEFRAERLSEGNTTQGLQSVEDDITKALKALTEQKYQVAVIAAMKAGKSTFLNAIIGADVLASESEACTVCRTDIHPIEAGKTPRLLEYQEGKRQPVLVAEGEAGELRQKFLKRTHEIRVTANRDNTTRFKLEHPIEAIHTLSSLAGFTLVDTPGPNEWESANFNTLALKQTALEALRTCNAILFILDYTSFKDNTNAELFQDLIEQRSDFLAQSKEKIYFILNKVDRKSEKDRPITSVIEDLRVTLVGFGIPEPIIYPVSAWQGLLAKLIENKTATKEHKADFKNFFLARYIEEDEDGETHVPKLTDIAPQALHESGITTIENAVIQTVVHNSGWNLLSEVLATLDKASQAIDETFITGIRGWKVEFDELKQKIKEYKKCSDSARNKVASVKRSVEEQKQRLIREFSLGIHKFASNAKKQIEKEIENFVKNQSKNTSERDEEKNLFTYIWKKLGSFFEAGASSAPYKIRVNKRRYADEIGKIINDYCTPIIQKFWLDTQDKLVRNGTKIREDIVQKIQKEIQAISDEVSKYIGNALEVEIGTNPIEFPQFEFSGLDASIAKQQEVFTRTRKETRNKSRCCASDESYEVDVPYQETVYFYEIDLKLTSQAIQKKIDEQVQRNIELLQRVIQKQVSEDFQKGEKQINDYINRFQSQFDNLLKERATREVKAPEIVAMLESQRIKVNEYLTQLQSIQEVLDSWKPMP